MHGPDAHRFLDNLLTQDLDPLAVGGCAYAALLSPQGKVLSDLFVWRLEEQGFLLDAPAARAELLAARLRLFKLRAKVEIEAAPQWCAVSGDGELAASDPRLPALGVRALSRTPPPSAQEAALSAQRLALGVPDLAQDAAPEEVFALEALLEELNGVSFKKGCFPGQENVSRMKRRATTRRKFCRVRLEGAAAAGAAITAGGVDLGSLRAAQGDVGLAFLRLDRALAAAAPLLAGAVPLRLDPPEWLILPAAQAGEE